MLKDTRDVDVDRVPARTAAQRSCRRWCARTLVKLSALSQASLAQKRTCTFTGQLYDASSDQYTVLAISPKRVL